MAQTMHKNPKQPQQTCNLTASYSSFSPVLQRSKHHCQDYLETIVSRLPQHDHSRRDYDQQVGLCDKLYQIFLYVYMKFK